MIGTTIDVDIYSVTLLFAIPMNNEGLFEVTRFGEYDDTNLAESINGRQKSISPKNPKVKTYA